MKIFHSILCCSTVEDNKNVTRSHLLSTYYFGEFSPQTVSLWYYCYFRSTDKEMGA